LPVSASSIDFASPAHGIKLGSPQNLTKTAREKGTDTIRQNRQDNENWRRAITYIEHFQMKYGQVNYSEISRQLNQNMQLSNERGAIQDKRSFSTSFFVSPLSKTLTALVKTRISEVSNIVATLPLF
jgi:hypothetical protein